MGVISSPMAADLLTVRRKTSSRSDIVGSIHLPEACTGGIRKPCHKMIDGDAERGIRILDQQTCLNKPTF
jgi:hypothetical protein